MLHPRGLQINREQMNAYKHGNRKQDFSPELRNEMGWDCQYQGRATF